MRRQERVNIFPFPNFPDVGRFYNTAPLCYNRYPGPEFKGRVSSVRLFVCMRLSFSEVKSDSWVASQQWGQRCLADPITTTQRQHEDSCAYTVKNKTKMDPQAITHKEGDPATQWPCKHLPHRMLHARDK